MNVLLTTISLDLERGGGTAERTRCLAEHLRALGMNSRVLTLEGGGYADVLRAKSIPVTVTGHVRLRYHIPSLNFYLLRRLVDWSDVIHILGYWNILSLVTSRLATACDKPFVLSAAGEFAALERPRWDQRAFHYALGRKMIGKASSIIAITPLERQLIINRLGVDPASVVVIPNGVSPIDAPVGDEQILPSGRFILFLGRLAYIKGPDLLLEAFAKIGDQCPDVSLVFAGPDFGIRAMLESRTASLGLANRVTFTGFLNERMRWEAYRRATVLAVPSRSEAMSLVALEAAAVGTPILISDRCGFDEIVECDGALAVRPDVDALGSGLMAMLSEQIDLGAMGRNARSLVLEKYDWSTVTMHFADHLDRLRRDRKTQR